MLRQKNILRKTAAAAMAVMMTAGLAACGEKGKTAEADGTETEDSYVWAASYTELASGESTGISNVNIIGSRAYFNYATYSEEYKQEIRYLDLEKLEAGPVTVLKLDSQESQTEEGFMSNPVQASVYQDGGLAVVTSRSPILTAEATQADYERQMEETTYSLKKVSEDGTEVFNMDITSYLRMDKENSWLQYAMPDKDGNLYLSNGSSYVWVFDKEGNHLADVKLETASEYSHINAMGVLPDGRMAIVQDTSQHDGVEIKVYNEAKKTFSDIYGNLPNDCWNTGIGLGVNGGVMLRGNEGLYEYDLETQTYIEVLKWIECDINPDYIEFATAMPDGRIAAYSRDWNSGESSLIMLTKTPASEVVQKETLTLGCIGINQNLQRAVVNFNKTNEKYRITIKDYLENVESADGINAYQDAITAFNNDILTGAGPDLFTSNGLNLDQLAAKGVIEDLAPYLENSTVVKRSDLFEGVLSAYTKSDVLCAIPSSFAVTTMLGRASEVGEEPGWTLDEMIAYAEQYPDSEIFAHAQRQDLLHYALIFNMDSHVNWETGECSFDTPEFKKILEFAARYPAETDYTVTEPKLLGSHEALLALTNLDDPFSWQLYEAMFGEPITAIGFPSDSSGGVLVMGNDGVCISAASENKEAAWSFIENLLSEEAQKDDFMRWGFPIRTDAFDEMMQEAMKADYQYDENGEIMLDENGEPVEYSHRSYGWDDISFDLYSVKQEEADSIKAVIDRIDGIMSYNEPLLEIITEEAEPYFAGQKTVDEVADIMQSRIQIYVNESR